ncbi:Flp pilus assembly protein TadB [Burkholderia sp. 8Y]|uniref:type II secretion system F family protein n=1 Tax=Burkholderia sp. 8Y TaxID=2653133 RepID=UPI0012F16B9A|nr:type II secretion system F family protein [Burkholderia sp. 8Y]VXC72532.1 Flp pilus assembly protein TadB [Burkholderia sp. 8Y]
MNINLLTLCTFVIAILAGVMFFVFQDMRKSRPHARIQARMQASFASHGFIGARERNAGQFDTDLFKVNKHDNAFTRFFGPKVSRLKAVAGASGMRIVIVAALLGLVIALVMSKLMPLPGAVKPLLVLGLPVFATMKSYTFLVARFRRRFLDGFPDVIDLIVRAVRAGVPVTHVISTAADECPEPLRSEFKLMSDSLQVGLDLEEVLAMAMQRIEIADFSFFCVCLLLQRETGGQLGETLENLAGIVRTRREIRTKAKALTGEARITTKILAAVPVCIIGSMFFLNRDYAMVLFETEAGKKLMTFGVISIAIGLTVINKISKLDTSR